MTNAQKIALRLSEVRQRLNEVAGLEGETFTDEVRSEAEGLQVEYRDLETRHRAAIVAEGQPEIRPAVQDAEHRERVELRSRAHLGNFLLNALRGSGRVGCRGRASGGGGHSGTVSRWNCGTPRARWSVAPTTPRTPPAPLASTSTPSARRSLPTASRPGWASKCHASSPAPTPSATITTSLTSAAEDKSGVVDSTAAAFTVTSATPKRVSARLSLTLEDVAAIGQMNFESALRENLSLILSDQLDPAGN